MPSYEEMKNTPRYNEYFHACAKPNTLVILQSCWPVQQVKKWKSDGRRVNDLGIWKAWRKSILKFCKE